MNARVLIIEDEVEVADLIALYLRQEGIIAESQQSAEDGLAAFHQEGADLIVLDINLPGMDGFEFLQNLRKESKVPVVIVSAREADEDIVRGLGVGADDFVTKPFSPKVLAARIRAHLRRAFDDRAEKQDLYRFGPFSLDTEAWLLQKAGQRVALSPREFEVLRVLLENAGKPLTPDQIYESVWGNRFGDVATVAVHIQRLRRKIEDIPSDPIYIQTIHGFGYRFNPQTLERRHET